MELTAAGVLLPCADACRLTQFLPEATADKVAYLYHQPHLLDHYKAARKTCEGQSSNAPY
jgi:hypothetical protein